MRQNNRIALFIDFDNAQIEASDLKFKHCRGSQLWVAPLIHELEAIAAGSVDIRRCYGNVMLNAARRGPDSKGAALRSKIDLDQGLQMDLFNNGFQMIHMPDFSGKNRADIFMTIDCMEVAAKHSEINIFAILSLDSDFSPLIHRLRAMSREIVLITVGERSSKGRRSMVSMANYLVTYDQDVIDRAAFDILEAVIGDLAHDRSNPLASGVALSAILALMKERNPTCSVEAVGFESFKPFVQACLEDISPQTRIEGDRLRLVAKAAAPPEPRPAVAKSGETAAAATATPLPVKAPAVEPPESERANRWNAILKKQNIRPLPELRNRVHALVREQYADSIGTEPITYGALCDNIEHLLEDAASKSQVGDVLRTLCLSGVIELLKLDGFPLKESHLIRIGELDDVRIAKFYINRIEGTGICITETDFPALAQLIFGSSASGEVAKIRSAFRLELPEEEEESRSGAEAAGPEPPGGPGPTGEAEPGLTGPEERGQSPRSPKDRLLDLLYWAILANSEPDDPVQCVTLSDISVTIRMFDPEFEFRNYGFSKGGGFKAVVDHAVEQELVSMYFDQEYTMHRITLRPKFHDHSGGAPRPDDFSQVHRRRLLIRCKLPADARVGKFYAALGSVISPPPELACPPEPALAGTPAELSGSALAPVQPDAPCSGQADRSDRPTAQDAFTAACALLRVDERNLEANRRIMQLFLEAGTLIGEDQTPVTDLQDHRRLVALAEPSAALPRYLQALERRLSVGRPEPAELGFLLTELTAD